jgi:hypothetical protein
VLRSLTTAVLLLLLAAGLLCAAIGLRGRAAAIGATIVPDEDRYYLPPAEWLRAFCLGYNEAAADFLWATTLVYFGGKKHWVGGGDEDDAGVDIPRFTVNYLSLVTDLDPRFLGVYREGGRLTLYQGGRITKGSVKMAMDLLEKGRRQFPDDGDITFNLGFLHYYEMEPFLPEEKDSPERRFHKEEGTHLLRMASTMDGAPPYLSLLAGTLLSREGLEELVVEHLRSMLMKETDPSIRKSLEAQLYRAMGEAAVHDMEAMNKLQERWHATMVHVPFDLFLLVQPSVEVTAEEILDPANGAEGIIDDAMKEDE